MGRQGGDVDHLRLGRHLVPHEQWRVCDSRGVGRVALGRRACATRGLGVGPCGDREHGLRGLDRGHGGTAASRHQGRARGAEYFDLPCADGPRQRPAAAGGLRGRPGPQPLPEADDHGEGDPQLLPGSQEQAVRSAQGPQLEERPQRRRQQRGALRPAGRRHAARAAGPLRAMEGVPLQDAEAQERTHRGRAHTAVAPLVAAAAGFRGPRR
mmetsp:Transcript_71414/g.200269  ORF Transcript_71414/g.200269 Transcript_71414/m.200269 type:complete len:211 (-) Transcript_71414:2-634(-)